MARGQRLQAGDARDHPPREGEPAGREMVEDAQRAVVERRVAPDQQRHGAVDCASSSPAIDRRRSRGARPRRPRGSRPPASRTRHVELDDPGRGVRRGSARRSPAAARRGRPSPRPCAGSAPESAAFSAPIAWTVMCSGLPVPMPMTTISSMGLPQPTAMAWKKVPLTRPRRAPEGPSGCAVAVEELGERRVAPRLDQPRIVELVPAHRRPRRGRSAHRRGAAPGGSRGSSCRLREARHMAEQAGHRMGHAVGVLERPAEHHEAAALAVHRPVDRRSGASPPRKPSAAASRPACSSG